MQMAWDAAAQQEAAAACMLVNAAHWQLQHAHVLFKVRMHVGYSGSMHTWQKPPPLQRAWGLIVCYLQVGVTVEPRCHDGKKLAAKKPGPVVSWKLRN